MNKLFLPIILGALSFPVGLLLGWIFASSCAGDCALAGLAIIPATLGAIAVFSFLSALFAFRKAQKRERRFIEAWKAFFVCVITAIVSTFILFKVIISTIS